VLIQEIAFDDILPNSIRGFSTIYLPQNSLCLGKVGTFARQGAVVLPVGGH
jgi:hypothetical protein